MILKLAWRNLWRNKRRTLISVSAVTFAVLFSSTISSFQKGTWDHMVDNVVRSYLGYLQIHQKGFWDDQTLENTFEPAALPAAVQEKYRLTPRLENFALASSGEKTKGVLVCGIDPESEDLLTGLKSKVIDGKYLSLSDTGALVAFRLAELLNLKVGDTLILLSQGYQGQTAVGAYPVIGLVKFGPPELDKQMVYLPLPIARFFNATGDRLTTYAVNLSDRGELNEALSFLKKTLPDSEFEVMDYRQLMPELIEAQELDTAASKLILWVLYLLITFGLFGTVLMMTRERTYEFGVLTAIGTKRRTLSGMIWAETVFIGIVGSLMGILISIPIVWYLHTNPIELWGKAAEAYIQFGVEPVVKAAFFWPIFFRQAIIIFVISCLLSAYGFWYILKLKAVQAMRQ